MALLVVHPSTLLILVLLATIGLVAAIVLLALCTFDKYVHGFAGGDAHTTSAIRTQTAGSV